MATFQSSANATIPVGSAYDTTKFILGNILTNGKIELIPKFNTAQFKVVQAQVSGKPGYKVFHIDQKKLLLWDGSSWGSINDATAGSLAANTTAGQTVISVSNTAAPTAGQVLTATSGTEAVWADATGGGGSLPTNASYTTLIGNGVDTTITITHGLNTESIIYGVWEATGLKRSIECSVSILSVNAIQLHFNTAPLTGAYRVIIICSVFSNAIVIPPSLPDQVGQNGKFLSTDGSNASWQFTPSQVPSPSGHSSQFLSNDGTNFFWTDTPAELPVQTGNAGRFLSTNGSAPSWQIIPTWMANPMSTAGDMIIGGMDGAAGRLGIGATGAVLTVLDGNTFGWRTLLPDATGSNGKFLTTNGTVNSWASIRELPVMSGLTNAKILSNDGTNATWINNTLPPDVTGNSGRFLTNNGTTLSWGTISQVPVTTGHSGHILTNDGSSVFWNSIASVLPSGTGNSNKFLMTDGSAISWQDPPSGFSNPMTTHADLIVGYLSGEARRLPAGTNGQVLSTVTNVWDPSLSAFVTQLQWVSLTGYLTNPMTTQGDTIYGGASGAPSRLALGSSGSIMLSNGTSPYWLATGSNQQVLTSNGSTPYWLSMTIVPPVTGHAGSWLYTDGSTAYWNTFTTIPTQTTHGGQFLTTDGTNLSWATVPAGFANPMTTAGDMIVGTSGGAAGRMSAGSDGQVLTIVSGSPSWQPSVIGLPTQAGNNGRFLTTSGTVASWSQIYQVPSVVGQNGLFLGNDGTNYSWMTLPNQLPTVTGQAGKYLSTDGNTSMWVPYSGLPSLTGNSGKILTTDGVTSFWVNPSSAGTNILSRLPITVTSSVLAILSGEIKTVDTTCKTFQIQTISSDTPCRVRVYGTYAAASADYLRSSSLDPSGNHGMYLEVILTQANPSWTLSPIPTCANEDTVTNTNIYISIINNGSSTKAIQLNLELLKME